MPADKRYCDDCGKPLGSTEGKCFECGGRSNRCGTSFLNKSIAERLRSALGR